MEQAHGSIPTFESIWRAEHSVAVRSRKLSDSGRPPACYAHDSEASLLTAPEAPHLVIVHDPHRLHPRIHDRRPAELEAARFQVL
jgi:hypothetical protein